MVKSDRYRLCSSRPIYTKVTRGLEMRLTSIYVTSSLYNNANVHNVITAVCGTKVFKDIGFNIQLREYPPPPPRGIVWYDSGESVRNVRLGLTFHQNVDTCNSWAVYSFID